MKKTHLHTIALFSYLFAGLILFSSCGEDENDIPQIPQVNDRAVGASSEEFFTDKEYDKLVVEIQYTSGDEPDERAIQEIKNFLTNELVKPEGIEIYTTRIATPGKPTYSISDIKTTELYNRTQFTHDRTLSAYILLLDGKYDEDSVENGNVIGLPYRNTSMVIFQKTIQNNSGSLNQPSTWKMTAAAIAHVLGHNLGSTDEKGHITTKFSSHCSLSKITGESL